MNMKNAEDIIGKLLLGFILAYAIFHVGRLYAYNEVQQKLAPVMQDLRANGKFIKVQDASEGGEVYQWIPDVLSRDSVDIIKNLAGQPIMMKGKAK